MLRGVLERQARYILIDPYANAFWSNYRVAERKFEADSLLYPIWFAYDYYKQTGDASIFTPTVRRAFAVALAGVGPVAALPADLAPVRRGRRVTVPAPASSAHLSRQKVLDLEVKSHLACKGYVSLRR